MMPLGRLALGAVLLAGLVLAIVDPITFALYVTYAAVGGYLVDRRPRNAIGWLLIGIGFTQVGTTTPTGFDIDALAAGTGSFRDLAHAWISGWVGGAGFLLYAAVALVFPSGHVPPGPAGRVMVAGLAVGVLVLALPAFSTSLRISMEFGTETLVPNPLGLLPDPSPEAIPALQLIVTAVPIAVLAGSVVNLLIRYRRAHAIEALQIRWLLAAVAFVVSAVIFGLIGFVLSDGTQALFWLPALLAYPSVALAVGVAVTRYRLFEIDRIVSRTLGWTMVTLMLVAVFAALVVGLQAVLVDVTQGQTLAVAASTLVAFALFQPVRRRVQTAVDRRFDRSRYDGERTAAAFADRLRDQVDLVELETDITGTVGTVLRPSAVAVWMRTVTNADHRSTP